MTVPETERQKKRRSRRSCSKVTRGDLRLVFSFHNSLLLSFDSAFSCIASCCAAIPICVTGRRGDPPTARPSCPSVRPPCPAQSSPGQSPTSADIWSQHGWSQRRWAWRGQRDRKRRGRGSRSANLQAELLLFALLFQKNLRKSLTCVDYTFCCLAGCCSCSCPNIYHPWWGEGWRRPPERPPPAPAGSPCRTQPPPSTLVLAFCCTQNMQLSQKRKYL